MISGKRTALFAAGLALVCLLAAWQMPQGTAVQPPAQPPGAQTDSVLVAAGRLAPERWASLSFPESGTLAKILVREGERVSGGAVLARLGDERKSQARIAAAELELLLAQQALDELYRHAELDLALAGQNLAEARQEEDSLRWKAASLQEPTPPATVEQAYANMLLAGQGLENARKDLRKAEKLWKDKRNPAWHFIPQHAYRLNLLQLEHAVIQAEAKYNHAVEKYDDLQEPVDAIDLERAETGLALATARVQQAVLDRQVLLSGPDPDRVSLAEARLRSAKAELLSAQAAYAEAQLYAPFSGRVVTIPAKEGEWLLSGKRVMALASEGEWIVEIDDLEESEVTLVQAGQQVAVTIDALPGIELEGMVDSTALIYGEKDGDVIYQVIIALAGSNPDLRWGMTARVRFPGR